MSSTSSLPDAPAPESIVNDQSPGQSPAQDFESEGTGSRGQNDSEGPAAPPPAPPSIHTTGGNDNKNCGGIRDSCNTTIIGGVSREGLDSLVERRPAFSSKFGDRNIDSFGIEGSGKISVGYVIGPERRNRENKPSTPHNSTD